MTVSSVSRSAAYLVSILLLTPSPGVAALIDRGSGFIYDQDLDITWQADAGQMVGTWSNAMQWASQSNSGGVVGWRLPTAGEMQHLFYNELGGSQGVPIELRSNANFSLFQNVGPSPNRESVSLYWSNRENPADLNFATGFRFNNSIGSGKVVPFEFKWHSYNHAWAVHDGDIALPEPSSVGLLALVVILGSILRATA